MKDYEKLDDITKNWYKPERFSPALDNRHKILYKFMGEVKNKIVLEVGFGAGELLMGLAKKGAMGTGIDISSIAVSKMKDYIDDNSIGNISVFQMSATEMEFDQKFDIIILMDVLEHIENDEGVIEKCYSLLNNSGSILMNVPCNMSLWSNEDELYGHYRRYQLEELVNKFSKYGFELSVYRYSEGLFFKIKNLYKAVFRIEGTADTEGLKNYSFFDNLRVISKLFFILDDLWSKIFKDGASIFVKFQKKY